MLRGCFNVVVDLQFGSCGKGLIAGYLAERFNVTGAGTNNLPNAGHTIVLADGRKFVSKLIPVSAFLRHQGQDVEVYVGPGAGFFVERLLQEINECSLDSSSVHIHPRAMVVTEKHAEVESGKVGNEGSTKHLASTMQGSGAVQVERMMRGEGVVLARDVSELSSMVVPEGEWFNVIQEAVEQGMFLAEGSQGFSLGMLHGQSYPFCTSRECTVSRELTDTGISPRDLGDVYGVFRPYPIRVGNVVEGGRQVGYSGDWYPDQEEITWEQIKEEAGYPEDYDLMELTTVTKRVRRVATFSMEQIKRACRLNGVTKLVLNFANYLDYSCFGTCGDEFSELPPKVREFIGQVREETRLPVILVGTGPQQNHVWDFLGFKEK